MAETPLERPAWAKGELSWLVGFTGRDEYAHTMVERATSVSEFEGGGGGGFEFCIVAKSFLLL